MAGAQLLVYVNGAHRLVSKSDIIDVAGVDALLVYPFEIRAGESININDPVYISNDGTIVTAKADSFLTSRVVGVALSGGVAGDTIYVYNGGKVDGASLDGGPLTPGQPVYLSPNTAGAVTATPPTPPNILVELGIATDTNAYFLQIDKPIIRR